MSGRAEADTWARACPSTSQSKGGKLRRERREETMVSRIAIRPTIFKGLELGLIQQKFDNIYKRATPLKIKNLTVTM